MHVKGSVEYSSVHRRKSQMSWVHIPAVILRQVLSVSDSISLSVKWEFSCLKLCSVIVKIILRKCSVFEMVCTLYWQRGWKCKTEDKGPGAGKRHMKVRSAGGVAFEWPAVYSWRHQGLLKWCRVNKADDSALAAHLESISIAASVHQQLSHIGSQGLSASSGSSVPFSA